MVRFFSLRDKWGLGVLLSEMCGDSDELIIQGERPDHHLLIMIGESPWQDFVAGDAGKVTHIIY